MRAILKIALISLIVIVFGCTGTEKRDNFIVAIASDVQTFNPAFTMTMTEGNISELLYLGLVGYNWNENKGVLEPYPLLAEKWEWNSDSTSVEVFIDKRAKWSDGKDVTADDVLFTYDIYSDPDVQSKFYGSFENFELEKDNSIDLKKTFLIINDKTIKITFKKGGIASTFCFDLPLLPKHIFGNISRKELVNAPQNLTPVGSGPYKMSEWKKNQYIKLSIDRSSYLAGETSINEILFKVIPDYNSRIVQLKKGEIDFAEELKASDVKELSKSNHLNIVTVKGRDYDYLGLNNINPASFSNRKIEQHPLFGDSLVRKAIAYAVDREMIVDDYLGGYGKTAVTPVAPIFKTLVDSLIKPYPYSLKASIELLTRAGWKDNDNDGILDRGGKKFSFKLAIQGNNKLRNEIATIIKDNLKQIGAEVTIEVLEPAIFVESMFGRKFDAFISGWSVPIPIDLSPYWSSDLENNPANTAGYRSKKADLLLSKMKSKISDGERSGLYKEFQKVIYNETPVVFLFWSDKIVAFNKRLANPGFSPLGTVHYCWNWRLAE